MLKVLHVQEAFHPRIKLSNSCLFDIEKAIQFATISVEWIEKWLKFQKALKAWLVIFHRNYFRHEKQCRASSEIVCHEFGRTFPFSKIPIVMLVYICAACMKER